MKRQRGEIEKKLKKETGITLIALVVTIIILLILAGITIGTLTGEKGIINKAKEAKQIARASTSRRHCINGSIKFTNGVFRRQQSNNTRHDSRRSK